MEKIKQIAKRIGYSFHRTIRNSVFWIVWAIINLAFNLATVIHYNQWKRPFDIGMLIFWVCFLGWAIWMHKKLKIMKEELLITVIIASIIHKSKTGAVPEYYDKLYDLGIDHGKILQIVIEAGINTGVKYFEGPNVQTHFTNTSTVGDLVEYIKQNIKQSVNVTFPKPESYQQNENKKP